MRFVRRNRKEVTVFESKKKKAAREAAEKKISGYVHQDMKRTRRDRESYQDRCGHCHGSKVMSNGKPCRNCGGSGTITRFR